MNKVTVFAPASIGNVSCGFDALGFAVDSPGDRVTIEKIGGEEVLIREIMPVGVPIPTETQLNTAGVAVLSFLKALGRKEGLAISLHKGLPLGSGMGSSAASGVAAVVAVNHLMNAPMQLQELLPFALEAEAVACGSAHADNAAPCLLGGFTLVRSYHPLDVVKVPLKAELWCTLVHPHFEVKTRDARKVLPKNISLPDAVKQAANTAGLMIGLMQPDYELIGKSLVDVIAEPARAHFIPDFQGVKGAALAAGALGCGISGSGPSMFALSRGKEVAKSVGEEMRIKFAIQNINCDVHVSPINQQGAKVIS